VDGCVSGYGIVNIFRHQSSSFLFFIVVACCMTR